jgi:hypothetical protein
LHQEDCVTVNDSNSPNASDDEIWIAHLKNVTTIIGPDGVARKFVPAEDFSAMSQQNDDRNRALALINASALNGDLVTIRRILNNAGHTPDLGRAVGEIVAAVRSGNL